MAKSQTNTSLVNLLDKKDKNQLKISKNLSDKIDKIKKVLDSQRIKKLFNNATPLNKFVEKNKEETKQETVKATKIDNLESSDESLVVLQKILSFMQKNYDEDKKSREEELNFAEEQKLEKDKKDKEFLEALKAQRGDPQTAERIEKESGGKGLSGIIDEILGAFGPAGQAIKMIYQIGSFFLTPLGLGLLGGATLLTLLMRDEHADETNQGIQNAGKSDGGLGEAITNIEGVDRRKAILLREAHKSGKIKSNWWQYSKVAAEENAYLKEIGFDPKTGLTDMDREKGFNYVDDETGEATYSEYVAKKQKGTTETTPVGGETNQKSTAPATSGETTSSAPASSPSTPAAAPLATSTASSVTPTSSAVPTPTPNAGEKLSQVTGENVDNKLMEDLQQTVAPLVNSTANVLQNSQSRTSKQLPAVRNMEETFQRMIYNSTRVV